jgi:hypothetical protein
MNALPPDRREAAQQHMQAILELCRAGSGPLPEVAANFSWNGQQSGMERNARAEKAEDDGVSSMKDTDTENVSEPTRLGSEEVATNADGVEKAESADRKRKNRSDTARPGNKKGRRGLRIPRARLKKRFTVKGQPAAGSDTASLAGPPFEFGTATVQGEQQQAAPTVTVEALAYG